MTRSAPKKQFSLTRRKMPRGSSKQRCERQASLTAIARLRVGTPATCDYRLLRALQRMLRKKTWRGEVDQLPDLPAADPPLVADRDKVPRSEMIPASAKQLSENESHDGSDAVRCLQGAQVKLLRPEPVTCANRFGCCGRR